MSRGISNSVATHTNEICDQRNKATNVVCDKCNKATNDNVNNFLGYAIPEPGALTLVLWHVNSFQGLTLIFIIMYGTLYTVYSGAGKVALCVGGTDMGLSNKVFFY